MNWSDTVRKWSKYWYDSDDIIHWFWQEISLDGVWWFLWAKHLFITTPRAGIYPSLSQTRPGEVNWSDTVRKWSEQWLESDDKNDWGCIKKFARWSMMILMSKTPLYDYHKGRDSSFIVSKKAWWSELVSICLVWYKLVVPMIWCFNVTHAIMMKDCDDSYEQSTALQLLQGQGFILHCLKQGLVKWIGLILSGNTQNID